MELKQIRRLTIAALKSINPDQDRQMTALFRRVQEFMYREDSNTREVSNYGDPPARMMNRTEEEYFFEVFNDLLSQGIVAMGEIGSHGMTSHPWFIITSYGKKVLEQDEITPHDVNGYFQHVKTQVPNLDELALRYLQESVECFLKNNYIASSILLGVSSEIIFNQLFDVFKNSKINSKEKQKEYNSLSQRATIGRKYNIISKKLQSIRDQLGSDIEENLNIGFEGIFTLIRLQRNELGHPSGIVKRTEINKENVHAQLIIFIMYCKMVYSIMNKIKQ